MHKLTKFVNRNGVSSILVEGRTYTIDKHPRIFTGKVETAIRGLAKINKSIIFFDANPEEVAEYFNKHGYAGNSKLIDFTDEELREELYRRSHPVDTTDYTVSASLFDENEPAIEPEVTPVKKVKK